VRAPGVALIGAATGDTVRMAAAVANGVAEALHLGLEATASLSAIAVEGARNVVAHAYPAGQAGPLRMRIEPPPAGDPDDHEVTISFQDAGRGFSIWPTAGDPPGVGLSLVCELSERTQITTRRGVGTSIEAAVSVHDDFALERSAFADEGDRVECSINFEDTTLMAPVLPRALGAHVGGPEATVDQVAEASHLGEALAADLASLDGDPPPVRMPDRPDEPSSPLRIRVGPVGLGDADRLLEGLESAWAPRASALQLSAEPVGPDALACVDLALPSPPPENT
jgi:hypothetical protein